jgi:hypothetical protein
MLYYDNATEVITEKGSLLMYILYVKDPCPLK